MVLSTTEAALTILVIAAATLLTRVLPFLVFPAHKKTPDFVAYLGKVLPFAIIGMLIVYCFKSVSPSAWPYGIPELLASLFVIAVHKWKHNLLLSIGGGTILYMIMVQYLF
ncbi:branched-chain amino acid transporter permease [Paenibacillus chibensis]|uniref:branched-chain amino acid transporter permease n=1 Tax=Paenibacillus chibensis TaxID=59846 RepID=UPI000FD8A2C0|nr:branched-chain amino acid transporter permease [Paenibacillus chibensis]MEC0369611.1 branched-chain amino acid transporter permease [Paenibacillus chibensis]